MKKNPIRSRMVWVNAITLAVGVLGYVAGHEVIADHTAALSIMVAVQGGLNIVLRFLTSEAIV